MKKKVKELLSSFEESSASAEDMFSRGLLETAKELEDEKAKMEAARERELALMKEAEEIKKNRELEEERLSRMTEAQIQKEKEEEEREKLRRDAEAARARRLEEERAEKMEEERRQEEALEAERAWVASIEVSVAGFRKQFNLLPRHSKETLLQLYKQIESHPDKENFRKVKLNNAKFEEDFGKHPGGKEVFVAAGWKLQTLEEDVKILNLIEPNLETDMDAWMGWFDNIKLYVSEMSGLLDS